MTPTVGIGGDHLGLAPPGRDVQRTRRHAFADGLTHGVGTGGLKREEAPRGAESCLRDYRSAPTRGKIRP